jgi:hypothetical protein
VTSFSGQCGLAPAEERHDIGRVAIPRPVGLFEPDLVAGLGHHDGGHRNRDVLLEQLGEPAARRRRGPRRCRCPPEFFSSLPATAPASDASAIAATTCSLVHTTWPDHNRRRVSVSESVFGLVGSSSGRDSCGNDRRPAAGATGSSV